MEKKCDCKNGGCGKNRLPNRITVASSGGEITNRDLICRKCAYKKRGDTKSCLRFEEKPAEVIAGGKCALFLSDGSDFDRKGGCSDCSDCGGCSDCGSCGGCNDCGEKK